MAVWAILVNILFPIPLLTLSLLCCPLPTSISDSVRKFILRFVDVVLFLRIAGTVTVYGLLTTLSFVAFVVTAAETYHANRKMSRAYANHLPSAESMRCVKWRHERNFWISLFSLALWVILFRLRSLTKELQQTKAQLRETRVD